MTKPPETWDPFDGRPAPDPAEREKHRAAYQQIRTLAERVPLVAALVDQRTAEVAVAARLRGGGEAGWKHDGTVPLPFPFEGLYEPTA